MHTGCMQHHRSFLRIISLAILLFFLYAGTASAHKFFVTGWVEGDSVFLEAAFGDGSLAHNAEVIVYDEDGSVLLESTTNDQGEFNFKVEKKAPLKIKVKAGMGHQDEILIPLEEIALAFADGGVQGSSTAPMETATVPDDKAQPGLVVAATSGVTQKDIQQIIEKALDKKLRPIVRKLAAQDKAEKPKVQDIMGGIGYILGLVGLGTYVHYRRKK